ncbi:MAG: DUF3291 domain-containing protein [Pseudomonadota bacterium]
MARFALYTFGVFRKPSDDPANDGFHALDDKIWPILDRAPGLIGRSGYLGEPGRRSWGVPTYPAFYHGPQGEHSPSTLSLWECPEAAIAFAYHGLHAEALKRAREWFDEPTWPPYAVWWASDDKRPTWREAVAKHQQLHDEGPTQAAFNFKNLYDPQGEKTEMASDRMRAYIDQAKGN